MANRRGDGRQVLGWLLSKDRLTLDLTAAAQGIGHNNPECRLRRRTLSRDLVKLASPATPLNR